MFGINRLARRMQRVAVAMLFTASTLCVHAQTDGLRQGKLPNGLTYYICRDTGTPGEVHYYMYQNVGAILEDERQIGLAHVLEHLAFNTTEHFPDGVMTFLRGSGLQSFEAHTGLDETRYAVHDVPVNDPKLNEKMLLLLRDWCHGIKILPKDVDKERGIVIEEWRQRNDINHRLSDAIAPAIYNKAKYAVRNVIGTEEILRSFKVADVRRFYDTWYRPSMQCIAVIGDINPAKIESEVKRVFSSLSAGKPATIGDARIIPDNTAPLYFRFIDKDNVSASLGLYQRKKASQSTARKDATDTYLLTQLFNKLAPRRFAMLRNQGSENFIAASVSYSPLVRNYVQNAWDVVPYRGNALQALRQVLEVRESIRRNGFSKEEFEEVKAAMYKDMKAVIESKEELGTPDNLMDMFKQNFLYGDPITPFKERIGESLEHLLELEADDLNTWIRSWMDDTNLSFITYSRTPDEMNVSLEQFIAMLDSVKAKPVSIEKVPQQIERIVDFDIKPGKITAQQTIEQLGAKEWKLSNGARVLYKYLPEAKQRLYFAGSATGGKSVVQPANLPAYAAMRALAMQSGVYKYNRNDLYQWVKNKDFELTLSLEDYSDAIGGNSSINDAGDFFAYLHLVLAHQTFRQHIFDKYVQRSKYIYETRNRTGMAAVQDSIHDILFPPSAENPKANTAFYDRMKLDDVAAEFKRHFGNAANFTFCLVGSIPETQARQLIERYIASLPGVPGTPKVQIRPMDYASPAREINRELTADIDGDVGEIEISYSNDKPLTEREQAAWEVFRSILENRFFTVLREKEHITYSIAVNASYQEHPAVSETLGIHFTTERSRTDEAKSMAYRLLEEIARGNFSTDEFKNALVPLAMDENTADNDDAQRPEALLWMGMLNLYAEKGNVPPVADNEKEDNPFGLLTPNDVKAVATKVLTGAKHRDIVVKSLPPQERNWEK